MTTYNYIILEDSEAGGSKKFKTIAFTPGRQRTDSFQITMGGGLDKAAGVILKRFMYTLKLPDSVLDPDFGTYDDFIYLYDLNNPAGAPNDVITLVDHYGISHSVKFDNNLSPDPLTTMLEGPNAYFIVQISLLEIPVTGGSGS